MAENAIYKLRFNKKIADDIFLMRLEGPTGAITAPGQFVNVRIEGFYLRRPLSVCDWDDEGITLIYKVVGGGTARMAMFAPGTELDLLTGLGNGFATHPAEGRQVVLAGGGCGVPPLYGLAKALLAVGVTPTVMLGFGKAGDVFFRREFEALGCDTIVTTEDGSAGVRGFVTTPMAALDYSYYYSCGPHAMLAAVHALGAQKGVEGQLSFEEKMGCGFGACMGCSCHTLVGDKRVCVDGPVFLSREVSFDG